MSQPTHNQKVHVAMMLGTLSGLHAQAKWLEQQGVEGMDMVCCQIEDTFATLEPMIGQVSPAEALSLNG